jgi:hypothetical protein
VPSELLLSVEVGSTYTKLGVFGLDRDRLRVLGRAATRTSLADGDVGVAVTRLLHRAAGLGVRGGEPAVLTSSAAGGLRIAVCGLTPTLSTKVGTEVALGAGGVVVFTAAGRLSARQVAAVAAAAPSLVLVCGGTDHGEADAVLANVTALAAAPTEAVYVYAGNAQTRIEACEILASAGLRHVAAENVYPDSDVYRFTEVRDLIREIYERDVVKAPGVDALRERLGTGCVPTPLAVSWAVRTLGAKVGGLLAVDVGGATTDVHSYKVDGPAEDALTAAFEPALKRTVEGDLGLYHNLSNLVADDEPPPEGAEPITDVDRLRPYAMRAVERGLARHCGRSVRVHDGSGLREVLHGADLRGVPAVLLTGGALRHEAPGAPALAGVLAGLRTRRMVPEDVRSWLVDRDYLMSSLGALAPHRPDAVSAFMDLALEEGTWC